MLEIGEKILKQPYAFPTQANPLNRMAEIVNILRKLRFDQQQFNVWYGNDGVNVSLHSNPLGYPWGNQWTFGITITKANVVRVFNGKARRYGDQVYAMVPAGTDDQGMPYVDVTFQGDGTGQQIVWQWDSVGGLVISPNPVVGAVADDATYIRGILSVWTRANGQVALTDYQQCGTIVLPVFTKPTV